MNINHEIEEKAKRITRERKYVDLCIRAGICPACGEKIKLSHVKTFSSGVPMYVKLTCQSEKCDWSDIL